MSNTETPIFIIKAYFIMCIAFAVGLIASGYTVEKLKIMNFKLMCTIFIIGEGIFLTIGMLIVIFLLEKFKKK